MKIKRYVVTNMPQAMEQIREELGSDAVILSTKEIYFGGFLGWFRKRKIEVIAASDEEIIPARSEIAATNEKEKEWFLDEIKELKDSIAKIGQSITHENEPEWTTRLKEFLCEQECNEAVQERFITALQEHEKQSERPWTLNQMQICFEKTLYEIVSPLIYGGIKRQTKLVYMVGPTGVGKTTTIAKLAAEQMFQHQRKVGLITMDTYRIAAVDQLRTYASILNIPIEVVHTRQDMEQALERLKSCDLVILDTAGRNYLKKDYIDALKACHIPELQAEVFLTLSLTAKYSDMKSIVENFLNFPIDALIFTKKDETNCYGAILNAMQEFNVPVSYLTYGQNVPQDIQLFTAERLSSMFIGQLQ